MKATFIRGVSALAFVGLFSSVGSTAAAQGAAEPATINEVIVTASRRSERLMDLPMAVSAINEREIKDAGALTTRDLTQVAPGLTTNNNGKHLVPAIRGISSTGTSAGDEQNIALYIDGVYMTAGGGNTVRLANIERIEVLKGPQGTLFGRNATGGAIRIITRDPGPEREFSFGYNYGTKLKSQDFMIYASSPVTSTLAAGLSVNIYDDKGFVKSLLPGWDQGKLGFIHTWNARLKVAWTPTDAFKAILAYDYGRYKSDTNLLVNPVDGINAARNTPGVIMPTGPWETSYNFKPSLMNRSSGVSLFMELEQPKYTLQSTTAYRTNSLYSQLDNDRVNARNGTAISSNSDIWFTQELLYTSTYEGPLNYIAGLFYYRSDSDTVSDAYVNGPNTYPGGGLINLGTRSSYTLGYVKTKSGAAFADATYEISDAFKLIGGLRYTAEKKTLRTVPILPARAPSAWPSDSQKADDVSFRVTGQYHVRGETNLYATYSTGFKSGAYQASTPTSVQKAFPEKIKAMQAGFKTRVAGKIDISAEAFRYDYTNIQVQTNNSINGVQATQLGNAAKAKLNGVDGEVVARVTPNLRLKAAASWLPKATYTRYPGALVSIPKGFPGSLNPAACPGAGCGLGNDQIIRDESGSRVTRAPKFTANLGVAYDHELAGGKLEFTGNAFHSAKYYWLVGEDVAAPANTIVNGTIAWAPASGRFRFSVWGRNLTNEEYQTYNSPNAQGVSAAWGPPREIGFGVEYRY